MSSLSPLTLPGVPETLLAELVRAAAPDRLALVGGAVRDLLLHRVHNDPWRGLPDLDLVVEGTAQAPGDVAPAQRLARRLLQALGPERLVRCQEHGSFGTVELELRLDTGDLLLDVASARQESYAQPGANPQVRFGSLAADLARRDFTINAMALHLETGAGPTPSLALLDPHDGQGDLARRQLRFLHPASLRDDPSRILRGARYAARLGFSLAPEAAAQLETTLAAWPWPWRPGDPPELAPPALGTRLRMELELLLERENWRTALAALQRWRALPLLDGALQADRQWRRRLHWAERLELPRPAALVIAAADPLALAERLQLPQRWRRLLTETLALRQQLMDAQLPTTAAPSQWAALLEGPGTSAAAVALLLAWGQGPRRPLLRWWLRWRHLGSEVSAAELIASGVPPGPGLGERLRQLRAERLDRQRI